MAEQDGRTNTGMDYTMLSTEERNVLNRVAASQEEMRQALDKLYKTIYTGNGSPPVISDLAVLSSFANDIRKLRLEERLTRLDDQVGAVVSSVQTMVSNQTQYMSVQQFEKLQHEHEICEAPRLVHEIRNRVDAIEKETREAKATSMNLSAKRFAVFLTGITIIASLLSSVIQPLAQKVVEIVTEKPSAESTVQDFHRPVLR